MPHRVDAQMSQALPQLVQVVAGHEIVFGQMVTTGHAGSLAYSPFVRLGATMFSSAAFIHRMPISQPRPSAARGGAGDIWIPEFPTIYN